MAVVRTHDVEGTLPPFVIAS